MSTEQPAAGWYPSEGALRYWDGTAWTDHRQPLPPPSAPVVVTDAHVSAVEVAFAWVLTVLTGGYLLPWAIAATRGKSNSGTIALVNLLLGWTVVGWIVALVMACTKHRVVAVR
jgi:Superinfection immunity protein/Protein of unknown function (DUF2510)